MSPPGDASGEGCVARKQAKLVNINGNFYPRTRRHEPAPASADRSVAVNGRGKCPRSCMPPFSYSPFRPSRLNPEGSQRAPSSRTTPPGGRPGTTQTMKEVDNRSTIASPRGGVKSSVVGTRPTATKVNTIRLWTWTSLRCTGEVGSPGNTRRTVRVPSHGGTRAISNVVGGSRSGRGGVCDDGRPAGAGSLQGFPAGVRAAIRAQANRGKSSAGKSGTTGRSRVTTGGAKGGREVERPRP